MLKIHQMAMEMTTPTLVLQHKITKHIFESLHTSNKNESLFGNIKVKSKIAI